MRWRPGARARAWSSVLEVELSRKTPPSMGVPEGVRIAGGVGAVAGIVGLNRVRTSGEVAERTSVAAVLQGAALNGAVGRERVDGDVARRRAGDGSDLDGGDDLAAVSDGRRRERKGGGAGDEVGIGPAIDQVRRVNAAEARGEIVAGGAAVTGEDAV